MATTLPALTAGRYSTASSAYADFGVSLSAVCSADEPWLINEIMSGAISVMSTMTSPLSMPNRLSSEILVLNCANFIVAFHLVVTAQWHQVSGLRKRLENTEKTEKTEHTEEKKA